MYDVSQGYVDVIEFPAWVQHDPDVYGASLICYEGFSIGYVDFDRWYQVHRVEEVLVTGDVA